MRQYLIKRLLLMIPTLLGVAVLIFLLMRVVPGDLVELKHAGEGASVSAETLQKERELLGLDKPLYYQFGAWVWDIVRGDFGTSMWTGRPVLYEISIRFQLSLQLAVMATLLAVILAIPLGTLAALKQDTWVDYAIRIFSIAGLATPSFWLGIIVILGLLILFGWLPPMEFSPFWENPLANLSQLIWPTLAIGYRYSAMIMRMTRSSVLEVLREDYIRTARAKGLRERLILVRHALKNAMLPVISVIGLELAFLIGGVVVTEQVFNLNGLGRLLVQSIEQRDYTMTQSLVLLTAMFFILMNFVTDLLFAWLDPRVRYR
ncbi:MAG TPA: ABC transporter permease [Thermodesulfobacteriota bacterium]|nr:ABC transporter permease [Thermodesulfobacteriota bacterium]